MEPQRDLALGNGALARRPFRRAALGFAHRALGGDERAARLRHGQLGRAQRVGRAVVPLTRRLELRLREPLRLHRIRELPDVLLPR